MKNILITTWIQYDNYGSLLQAYCLSKVLEEMVAKEGVSHNFDVEVSVLNYFGYSPKMKTRFFERICKNSLKAFLKKINYKILFRFLIKNISRRKESFEEYRTQYLHLYPKNTIHSLEKLKKMRKFDIYIAGSDQIWNPKLLDEVYLLGWVPGGAKKVSYAPSICVDHLSETELKKYQVLESFSALSVREYTSAAEQISQLVHKKIMKVADPVILFGREKMLELCAEKCGEDYVAIYLLNGLKKRHELCKEFAKKSLLSEKIIPTLNPNSLVGEFTLRKQVEWGTGPLEFVNLIYNSAILVTDSFHGLIIALLLHKNFIILPREEKESQQNNRIIKLLEKVGLKNRFDLMPENIDEVDVIEWSEIDKKIEKMRAYSKKYLLEAIQNIL